MSFSDWLIEIISEFELLLFSEFEIEIFSFNNSSEFNGSLPFFNGCWPLDFKYSLISSGFILAVFEEEALWI